ncbi:MAG: hypothetical protein J6K73_16280 [Clostridia bacterium]|nr:hypothetical protein [Clostridia bacterium]MBR2924249.1 hypothetical protein [Clostridia bacterium]
MNDVYCSFLMKSEDVGPTIEALLASQREARMTIRQLRADNARLMRELQDERKKHDGQSGEEQL